MGWGVGCGVWALVGASATVIILITNVVWHYTDKKKMSKGRLIPNSFPRRLLML